VRGCRSVTTLLITAPWLLSLLGGSYSDEGSTVLRLMAAAVPFLIITNLYVSTSRIRQQMGRVVTIQLLTAVAVIALALSLVVPLGINGVGLAYLLAEAAAAAIVILPLIRYMRANDISLFRKPRPVAEPAPVAIPTT